MSENNKSKKIYNLAFDLGASSGRLMLSEFYNGKITLKEIHRFPNNSVVVNGIRYWNIFQTFYEMKEGLRKVGQLEIAIDGIGIDTWGVDYGLVDNDGNIIGMPINYRDSRTKNTINEVSKTVPIKELYDETGIQLLDFNTIFQLYADYQMRPEIMTKAKSLLHIPDLLNYFLTGIKKNEYTIASTGQYVNAKTQQTVENILDKLGISKELFCEMTYPGTILGPITEEIMAETKLKETNVINIGSHDTASAVAGTPFEDEDSAFLSCGTWSLLGLELDEPLINDDTFEYNYTNEGGVENKIRFLKNINGLWVMQNLRNCWNKTKENMSFPQIIEEARKNIDCGFIIDVNDPIFMAPLDMIDAIKSHCKEKGQGEPTTMGQLAMAVYNGLVSEYKLTVNNLEKLSGKKISCINMIGGGIQDELLCQLTSEQTGKKVVAGPIEGSVLGNVIMQLKAIGAIETLEEGRKIIKDSFPQKTYNPK